MSQNQYVPAGTYQLTSTGISITIKAKCKNTANNYLASNLTYSLIDASVIGDISNVNGVLTIVEGSSSIPNASHQWGEYVPAGSYQLNSKDIEVTINGTCDKSGGGSVQSPPLTFAAVTADCISDLSNNEGTFYFNTATVTAQGKAWVNSNDKRFMVNGVALQPGVNITDYDYPLSDSNINYMKTVVLPLLKVMHVNMIRIYQVDITASHDQMMNLLEQNGIYVMLEVENPMICVQTLEPVYDYQLYMRGTQVIDIFQKYRNTLGFSVGNETEAPGYIYAHFQVTKGEPKATAITNTVVVQHKIAAALKSFMRDMKSYIVAKSYRSIPVGVAIRDVFQSSVVPSGLIGTDICAEYYAGGEDKESRADFIGLNTYRYVTAEVPSQDPLSCYNAIATRFVSMPVPIVFSEIGAISAVQTWPRDWAIIEQMYTKKLLSDNFSGQVAFSFFNEKNNLGLYSQKPEQAGDIQPITIGGVDALINQFRTVQNMPVAMPIANPSIIPSPATCNPTMLPTFTSPNVNVTINNYATVALKLVQGGTVLADIAPGKSNTIPTPTSVMVDNKNGFDLFIQQPDTGSGWLTSCSMNVASVDSLADGDTIDNKNWGEACIVSK
jgi:hypothetical protein